MTALRQEDILDICRRALAEDVGSGDATSIAVVPADSRCTARLNTREECVCAGLDVASEVFRELDPGCRFSPNVADGDLCSAGTCLAEVRGHARALLTAERTALNFLQRLAGIATQTRRYVQHTEGTRAVILDTRKTTPGLRMLEKYAVSAGGGVNHRLGLHDRIMIKDNHRVLARLDGPDGIARAVGRCRETFPELEVEVEADTLDEVRQALDAGADIILLDNMNDERMRKAVKLVAGAARLEASGGITLERIAAVAATGVDYISVGALTHSVPAIDIGMEIRA